MINQNQLSLRVSLYIWRKIKIKVHKWIEKSIVKLLRLSWATSLLHLNHRSNELVQLLKKYRNYICLLFLSSHIKRPTPPCKICMVFSPISYINFIASCLCLMYTAYTNCLCLYVGLKPSKYPMFLALAQV